MELIDLRSGGKFAEVPDEVSFDEAVVPLKPELACLATVCCITKEDWL